METQYATELVRVSDLPFEQMVEAIGRGEVLFAVERTKPKKRNDFNAGRHNHDELDECGHFCPMQLIYGD